MTKKELIQEVHELLDTYCTGCFLNSYFRKEYGKHHAQTFCIKNCTVGEKLKSFGKQLS